MNELEIAYKEFEVGLMKESNITKTIIDKAIIMLEGGDDSVIYEASTDGLLTRLKERFKKIIQKIKEFLFGKKLESAQKEIDAAIQENPEAGNVSVTVEDTSDVSRGFQKLTKAFKSGKNFANEHKAFMALLAGGAGVAAGVAIGKRNANKDTSKKTSGKTKQIKAKDSKKYVMSRREELKFVEKAYADMDFDRIIRNHAVSDEQRRAAIINKRLSKDMRFDPKDLSVVNQYFDAVNAYGEFLNTSTLKCMKFTMAEMKNIERKKKNGDYGRYALSTDIKKARDAVIQANTAKIEGRAAAVPGRIAKKYKDEKTSATKDLKKDIKNIQKENNIKDLKRDAANKANARVNKSKDKAVRDLNAYHKNDTAYKNKYKRR